MAYTENMVIEIRSPCNTSHNNRKLSVPRNVFCVLQEELLFARLDPLHHSGTGNVIYQAFAVGGERDIVTPIATIVSIATQECNTSWYSFCRDDDSVAAVAKMVTNASKEHSRRHLTWKGQESDKTYANVAQKF